ncbi:MAG: bifunctional precorrin-2 dehydrogenase/sirohydrochlorin ferrochelatase [Planctomycetes bacterium]|nr:bifunctional precorrin-2 dehydrogenase/sirohydrochlorin ferrochelatase [Planctomycetota bacterium]
MSTEQDDFQATYPINLLLKAMPCLVVGGGQVAARKVQGLIAAGAKVTVLSPVLAEAMSPYIGDINYLPQAYGDFSGDLAGFWLVFAATSDEAVNKKITEECNAIKVFCCAVDENWKKGGFISPATIRKGGFTIGISTEGKDCVKSKEMKEKMMKLIDLAHT